MEPLASYPMIEVILVSSPVLHGAPPAPARWSASTVATPTVTANGSSCRCEWIINLERRSTKNAIKRVALHLFQINVKWVFNIIIITSHV